MQRERAGGPTSSVGQKRANVSGPAEDWGEVDEGPVSDPAHRAKKTTSTTSRLGSPLSRGTSSCFAAVWGRRWIGPYGRSSRRSRRTRIASSWRSGDTSARDSTTHGWTRSFSALPVAWKGTLVQYADRLHRLHPGKREVRIFDYVDREVPVLMRMFEKRLRGYRSIGYARGEAPLGYIVNGRRYRLRPKTSSNVAAVTSRSPQRSSWALSAALIRATTVRESSPKRWLSMRRSKALRPSSRPSSLICS